MIQSWKEWKIKKKEEYKKWKQDKLLKKQKKYEANKAEKSVSSPDCSSGATRNYTVSIAVPGSILDNAQSPELKTYLAGQIARAAAVFNVNEIIVFSEVGTPNLIEDDDQSLKLHKKNHGCVQLVRILQYLECPQYLRKYYFPIHKDLEYAGFYTSTRCRMIHKFYKCHVSSFCHAGICLLNPLDIPHHLRVDDESEFREGIVLKKPVKDGKGSFVYIGLRKTAVIDKPLEPNIRVTVQLDKEQKSKKHYRGKAVSPFAPYKCANIYWGYSVRLAKNLSTVISESPYKGGYDVTVGTSDKGNNVDSLQLPSFKHLLIVFGGLKGLEGCLEDESIDANDPKDLFHYYINTCPNQGSRTIRTEEAILITLAALRPSITALSNTATPVE